MQQLRVRQASPSVAGGESSQSEKVSALLTVCILIVWLLDLTFQKAANVTFGLWSVSSVLLAETFVMGTEWQ